MNKILIAYFSRKGNNYVAGNIINLDKGNTQVAIETIAKLIDVDIFKIDPIKDYSNDYRICCDEARKELNDNDRPELKDYIESIKQYDTIILAYPNWWNTMPMPVWAFLDKYDFTNKTILPLCTHEGSGIGTSENDIKKLCKNANILNGLAIRGSTVNNANNQIKEWLEKSGVLN